MLTVNEEKKNQRPKWATNRTIKSIWTSFLFLDQRIVRLLSTKQQRKQVGGPESEKTNQKKNVIYFSLGLRVWFEWKISKKTIKLCDLIRLYTSKFMERALHDSSLQTRISTLSLSLALSSLSLSSYYSLFPLTCYNKKNRTKQTLEGEI